MTGRAYGPRAKMMETAARAMSLEQYIFSPFRSKKTYPAGSMLAQLPLPKTSRSLHVTFVLPTSFVNPERVYQPRYSPSLAID